MEEKALTTDEVIRQLMEVLKGNDMKQAANSLYELCAYVDSMTNKVNDMTEEIAGLREDIRTMQEDTLANRLKQSLSEAADRLEKRCGEIKQQFFEVKDSIRSKAGEIMADFKMRGKAALNRVSEFIGLKDKLAGIRKRVKEGIADTNRTIAKIDSFGNGMREAGQKAANTFRTFADREAVDYSEKEKKFSKTEVAKKPWQWQKKVYEAVVLRLDAAIDKVEDLSRDVEISHERKQQADKEIPSVTGTVMQEEVLPVATVAEPVSYRYGAEAFEAAYAELEGKVGMLPDHYFVPKVSKDR